MAITIDIENDTTQETDRHGAPKQIRGIPVRRLSEESFNRYLDEHGEGEVVLVETVLGSAVFRAPTRDEYKRWREQVHDARKKSDATETLVRTCVLYPDRKTFDTWLDARAGIADECGDAVTDLAGATGRASVKR